MEKYVKFFLDKYPCSKTSMLFFGQGHLSRKNLSRAIFARVNYLSSALVKENLSYFSFTLPRKTCQGKTCQGNTCQGELSSVYSQQVFLRLVKENLLGFILMQISGLGIQQFSPAVLKEDFEATIAVLPVQFSVLLCSRIQYIVSSVRVVVVV